MVKSKAERNFDNVAELVGDRIRSIFNTHDPIKQDQILTELEFLLAQLDVKCGHYCKFLINRSENFKSAAAKNFIMKNVE